MVLQILPRCAVGEVADVQPPPDGDHEVGRPVGRGGAGAEALQDGRRVGAAPHHPPAAGRLGQWPRGREAAAAAGGEACGRRLSESHELCSDRREGIIPWGEESC